MSCKRCGYEIVDTYTGVLCPKCGSTWKKTTSNTKDNTDFFSDNSSFTPLFTPPTNNISNTSETQKHTKDQSSIRGLFEQASTTGAIYTDGHQQPSSPLRHQPARQFDPLVTGATSATRTNKSYDTSHTIYHSRKRKKQQLITGSQAIFSEIICSFFGIFGTGWFLVGERLIGTLLLLGSILIYWPLMIAGTIITFGFGLICLGPLAIVAIIGNIVLLRHVLKVRQLLP